MAAFAAPVHTPTGAGYSPIGGSGSVVQVPVARSSAAAAGRPRDGAWPTATTWLPVHTATRLSASAIGGTGSARQRARGGVVRGDVGLRRWWHVGAGVRGLGPRAAQDHELRARPHGRVLRAAAQRARRQHVDRTGRGVEGHQAVDPRVRAPPEDQQLLAGPRGAVIAPARELRAVSSASHPPAAAGSAPPASSLGSPAPVGAAVGSTCVRTCSCSAPRRSAPASHPTATTTTSAPATSPQDAAERVARRPTRCRLAAVPRPGLALRAPVRTRPPVSRGPAAPRPRAARYTDQWRIAGDRGPRDHCGVFAVFAPGEDAAKLCFFGLYALQHRGQESAGIAVSDGENLLVSKEMGLVSQVFDEDRLGVDARPHRHRPRALLHDRVLDVGGLAADLPHHADRAGPGARAQRQPRQHRGPRAAAGPRRATAAPPTPSCSPRWSPRSPTSRSRSRSARRWPRCAARTRWW